MIPPVECARSFEGDSCFRFMHNLRDVLWTEGYLKTLEGKEQSSPEAAAPKVMVLADAQWNIAHGKSGGGMACKGGHNGEPHNHNDVGSFLYLLGGDMLLTDLGAGDIRSSILARSVMTFSATVPSDTACRSWTETARRPERNTAAAASRRTAEAAVRSILRALTETAASGI